MEAAKPALGASLAQLLKRLKPFLDKNPHSSLKEMNDRCFIVMPWNDPTVRIKVTNENNDLIDALNQIILPPRFTAVWHRDSRDLEVIWGPIPRSRPEYQRSFRFCFDGEDHTCEFAAASDRLNRIVESASAVEAESDTNFRNLVTIKLVLGRMNHVPTDPSLSDYVFTSFWIRAIKLEDSAVVVRLIRHLNFYMRYFDRETPCIIVHDDHPANRKLEIPVQFVSGSFPAEMAARSLNDHLLVLWENTVTAPDPFRRYLYNFQILEYAAFYFLQEKLELQLKKIICAPEATANPQVAAEKALDAMTDLKMTDDQKFDMLIQQTVRPETVWRQIEPNLSFFCRDTSFEGGFTLPAMLKQGWTLEDFRQSWTSFPSALRKIRNALVHSREQRSATYIAPSGTNYDLLRPWIPLISSTAMEVILCFRI